MTSTEITEQDFERMLKFGKPSETIAGFTSKRFVELPFGLVKIDLPGMKDPTPEMVIETIMTAQYPEFDIEKATGNEVISFMLWVKKEQEFISMLEEVNLSSEIDPKLEAAGIREMDQFLGWNTVRGLAKEFGKDPYTVKQWEYSKVYLFMKMDAVSAKIDKQYQKIIKK